MEFGIFGPLEVRVDGKMVPLGGAKQRTLLAALLLEPNRVVAAERLVELLWRDEPPETAANNLQVYISQLRRALEPERAPGAPSRLLLSQSSGYLLVVRPDQLDLHRFERLADEGRKALAAGDADLAARTLRAALALWRGPALADVAEPFARGERARLEELRFRALEDRIEADLALGRHADLVGELEALAREHPLRERLCGQFMLALYRSGRQAEASAVFHNLRKVLDEAEGMEPGPELQQLFAQILTQDPAITAAMTLPPPSRPERTNLPLQLTSFVGRALEISAVKQLVSAARLVTLTGAGGIGKTRLALEVARQMIDDYVDGVWLVELAALTDPELVPQIVLATLGFRAQPGRIPMESLISSLAAREILCVIDNCEHLIEACARLADRLLKHCPRVRILATSREVLGVSGEIIWRVPSLATPDMQAPLIMDDLLELEAVQLFVQRAEAARPAFELTEDNASSVARICRRLDGIPLAIELAAARTRSMSITAIDERLDDQFRLLTGGSRVSMPRQRTLQATLDWSHDLLSDAEKRLFRRLSVFLGGFVLEAAETVFTDGEPNCTDVSILTGLTSLVDKSLVIWEERPDQSGRYRLLETIRQYAHDRLSETQEAEWARRRHAVFYLAFGDTVHRELRGPRQPAWMVRVDDELDNLRTGFKWALSSEPTGALRLAVALERYWITTRAGEGLAWLTRALEMAPARDELRAHGLYDASFWAMYAGHYDEARRLGRECLSLAEQLGSALYTGLALGALAAVDVDQGREGWLAVCLPLFEQAELHLRQASDPEALARLLGNYSTALRDAGDFTGGRPKVEEAVALARGLGDNWLLQRILGYLAGFEFDSGDTAAADTHWKQALTLAAELRSRTGTASALFGLARLAMMEKQPHRSLRLLAAACIQLKYARDVMDPPTARVVTETQDAAWRLIGRDAAEAAWREGARMSLAAAVRYGLGEPSETTLNPV